MKQAVKADAETRCAAIELQGGIEMRIDMCGKFRGNLILSARSYDGAFGDARVVSISPSDIPLRGEVQAVSPP